MDQLFRKLCIVLPPGLLATLELFHASGHHDAVYEALSQQIDRWLIVHYLQLLLFPLTAWSVYALSKYVDDGFEPAANFNPTRDVMSRVIGGSMAVFGIGYAAFDSIAGIGSGVLVKNSMRMLEIPGAPPDFEFLSQEIVQSYYHSPLVTRIAQVAIAAAILGFVLTGLKIYQRIEEKHTTLPMLMLAGACFGVTRSHSPPWGPITYSFVFVAALSVLFLAQRKTDAPTTNPTSSATPNA